MKKSKKPKNILSPKQKLFIQEYLVDKNAARAAKFVGYSEKTATEQGCRLLRNVHIKKAVEIGLREQLKKADLTADMVLTEIKKLAFVDLSEAYDEKGNLLHPHEMPEDVRKALSSIETHELFEGNGKEREFIGLAKKIKFASKEKALEMLAKYFKLLTDVQENKNSGTVNVVIGLPPKNERG